MYDESTRCSAHSEIPSVDLLQQYHNFQEVLAQDPWTRKDVSIKHLGVEKFGLLLLLHLCNCQVNGLNGKSDLLIFVHCR